MPIEAAVYYKQTIVSPETAVTDYYKLLYASYKGQPPNDADIQLYQTVPIEGREGKEVAIGQDATDRSAWIALMVRASDKPIDDSEQAKEDLRDKVREAIAGKTISLGVVPAIDDATRRLAPGGTANPEGEPLLVREFYRASAFEAAGIPLPAFQQVNVTQTNPGAIRGMHGESMVKLIAIAHGTAWGAWVDARPESPTRGAVFQTRHLVDALAAIRVPIRVGIHSGEVALTAMEGSLRGKSAFVPVLSAVGGMAGFEGVHDKPFIVLTIVALVITWYVRNPARLA